MADGDSLYDVSSCPSPQQKSFAGGRNRNTMENFISGVSGGQTQRGINETKGQLRHPSSSAFALPAPVANMTLTPSQQRSVQFQTPISNRRSSAKNKRKREKDYQAEVDAIENDQDDKDRDWQGTQESEIQVSPSKKKYQKKYYKDEEASAATKSPNKLFTNCPNNIKDVRRENVNRILSNWGDPKDWMPRSMLPIITRKNPGKRSDKRPLEDPKDWNEHLLGDLAYLSNSTKGQPEKAFEAIREAMNENERGTDCPSILKWDVRRAIEQIEKTKGRSTPPHTPPPPERASEETDISLGELLEQATAGMSQDELEFQLRTPRSQTFAQDIPIKQELPPSTTNIPPPSRERGRNRTHSNSVEVSVGSEKAWDKARTKRKLQIEDELLDVEDERLDIREKRLKIRHELLALKDEE